MNQKVLIINTGGTIAMVYSEKGNNYSPLRPVKEWSEITDEHPILKRFKTDYVQLPELIDSSDMNPKIWVEIGNIIQDNYEKYLGFVILHGTDTMAFTASALSFMCKNLSKPVILTGSQVPLQTPRSDALQNLITSIMIAGHHAYDVKLIPEVSIFFRDTLLRGNRARKLDASNYFGFASPNFSPLADVGGEIRVVKDRILKPSFDDFYIDPCFDENIFILDIFPGFNPKYIKNIADSNKELKGIILKTFGNGNAPTNSEFLDAIEYVTKKGIIVVDITQCIKGFVKMGLYEASAKLVDFGVISGADLTPEAATTKLMYLLGKGYTKEEIKSEMQVSIVGEQTINQYDWKYSGEKSRSTTATFTLHIPKNLDVQDIIKSVVRIKNIETDLLQGETFEVKVKVTGAPDLEYNFKGNNVQSIIKSSENLKDDIHFNFNSAVQSIVRNSDVINIEFSSTKEINWEKFYFSLYTESV